MSESKPGKRPRGYWTLERLQADALRFQTRGAWQKCSPTAYQAANKRGVLEGCCGHMVDGKKPDGHWTLERCKEDALRFETKSAWAQGSSSAYRAARIKGFFEACCAHMVGPRKPAGYWTLERCKEDALRFETKSAWVAGSSAVYSAAHKQGFLEECFGHMAELQKPHGYWTLERCKEDALRFETRSDWQKGSRGAYQAAHAKGFLEECCGHMTSPDGYAHWDGDGSLYIIQIEDESLAAPLFKIGISNDTSVRVRNYGLPRTAKVKVLLDRKMSYRDASRKETEILRALAPYSAQEVARQIMRNGASECFQLPDIVLEQIAAQA